MKRFLFMFTLAVLLFAFGCGENPNPKLNWDSNGSSETTRKDIHQATREASTAVQAAEDGVDVVKVFRDIGGMGLSFLVRAKEMANGYQNYQRECSGGGTVSVVMGYNKMDLVFYECNENWFGLWLDGPATIEWSSDQIILTLGNKEGEIKVRTDDGRELTMSGAQVVYSNNFEDKMTLTLNGNMLVKENEQTYSMEFVNLHSGIFYNPKNITLNLNGVLKRKMGNELMYVWQYDGFTFGATLEEKYEEIRVEGTIHTISPCHMGSIKYHTEKPLKIVFPEDKLMEGHIVINDTTHVIWVDNSVKVWIDLNNNEMQDNDEVKSYNEEELTQVCM